MPAVLVVHAGELGELLATQFAQYGLGSRQARSGEAALEHALHDRPAAVVVDAELPDVGGLELAELLRGELEVPVVLTYARSLELGDDGAAFLSRTQRLDAAFAKPFRSLELIDRVAALMGHPLEQSGPLAPPSPPPIPEDAEEEPEEDVLLLEDVVDQVLAQDPDALDEAAAPLEAEAAEDPFADLEIAFEDEPPAPAPEETASRSLAEFVAEPATSDPATLALLWKRVQAQPPPPAKAPPVAKRAAPGTARLTPRSLTETLDAFHQSGSSGEVWLTAGEERRVILMAHGVIAGTRSNVPSEELARLAVRRGLVTAADAARALSAVRGKRANDFIVAVRILGLAADDQLQRLLAERARRVVCGGFVMREGTLRVTYNDWSDREGLPIDLPVGDALLRAIVLTEPLDALRRAAPDDARFAPDVGGAHSLEALTLTAHEARLVVAMDGTKTIGDLRVLFDGVPERTLRGLPSALLTLGLLRLAGRGPAEPRRISFF